MARPLAYPIKKLIGFDPEMWRRIQDFRFKERLSTESDAVRQLIELGLKAAACAPKPERG